MTKFPTIQAQIAIVNKPTDIGTTYPDEVKAYTVLYRGILQRKRDKGMRDFLQKILAQVPHNPPY